MVHGTLEQTSSKPSLEKGTALSPDTCGQPESLTQPPEQLLTYLGLVQSPSSSMRTRNTFIGLLVFLGGFFASHQGPGISLLPAYHARTLSSV